MLVAGLCGRRQALQTANSGFLRPQLRLRLTPDVGEGMTGTKVVGFVIARPDREVVARGVF